jgi:outer membrane lipoprotein-sorting protein
MRSIEMKRNKNMMIGAAVLFAVLGMSGLAAAQMSGEEVMEQVYFRHNGDQMSAELSMVITNSRGSTRERTIQQYRSNEDGVEKKIMFFTSPADVRDTSFLSWSYDDGRADDQWIYLPALRRVKRISSDSKSDSFMGSDFTYDDMGERHPDADTHRVLRQETYDGQECYVVESIPVSSDEAFSKMVSWIIKDEWIGLKREYYDAGGDIYKQLEINSYEKIDGYWVITDMKMSNLEKGSSTRIQMNDVAFDENRPDSFFSERQMKMGPR